jgi:hypothetical protein
VLYIYTYSSRFPPITPRRNAMNTMASLSPSGKPQSQTQVTSSQLKRTTCNLCRERKVRCDREKPQCHRCRKSGQTCVYPSDKTDNDEIKSALNLLHSRLRKYAPDAGSLVNFSFSVVFLLLWICAYNSSPSGNEAPGTRPTIHGSVCQAEFCIPKLCVAEFSVCV